MQTKEELEEWYGTSDPWDYQTNSDDIYRKKFYLTVLEDVGPAFAQALDIGAGEGWITKDLPSDTKHAFEISDEAAGRLPEGVERVQQITHKYDLVLATGVLYEQYDHALVNRIIHGASSQTHGTKIMIAGIKGWLKPYGFGRRIRHFEIPYREYTHVVDVWEYA
tara:strand:- start:649 stop:1143 length:495 start_codon:yes stop_codon:yes gene_type:complete